MTATATDQASGLPHTPRVASDPRKAALFGWLIAVLGFGGFVAWAGIAPLDEGIPVSGQVVVTGNRKVVQNLSPGVVEAILVKDGDAVKAGDVLVRIDATAFRSQYETARSQWLSIRAAEARLVAESSGLSQVRFPRELLDEANDPRVSGAMSVQAQLLQARQASLAADLRVMQSAIAGLEAGIVGIEEARRAKEAQAALLSKELAGLRDLASEGYFPRNRLSEQERALVHIKGAIAEDAAQVAKARQSIIEMQMRMAARQQEHRKEIEAGLADAQKEASTLAKRMEGLAFELANTTVKAPAGGIVVGSSVHTVGGVLPAGQVLMEVVPVDEPLKVDVQIPVHMIDRVRTGLPVQINFPAFDQSTTPQIPGEVVQVAADATADPQGRMPPFYKGQVIVSADGIGKLRQHEIKAGMVAEVFIKTGERTLLNYLFKPLADRMRSALTER